MSKHQDREWLYEQYVEKELPPSKIAEKCDIHPDTVIYWRDKFGFPKVDHSNYAGQEYDQLYHDKEWLEWEYWEKKRNTVDIADECDVEPETIRRWLEKHGLGTRDQSEATELEWEGDDERREKASELLSKRLPKSIHPSIFTRNTGHVVATGAGDEGSIGIHRLLAISEYGPEAVRGVDVHHKNGIPWDNRPDNIELLTRAEHMREHRLRNS